MNWFVRIHTALAVAATLTAAPALAGTLVLNGTLSNFGVAATPQPNRCAAPQLRLLIGPGAPALAGGTSSLGAFSATLDECLLGPPPSPWVDSLFEFVFADGILRGTFTGNPTGGIPGGISFVSNYIVTGGTGTYADASGGFTGTGTVIFGAPTVATQTLVGTITTPEPGGALLFAGSLGLLGLALRRRA